MRSSPNRASDATNRRASPDVVKKRRAARRFNDLLAGAGGAKLDGRTEKRRQRLLDELKDGRARASGKELKPIDVLLRVQDLLDLGEPLATIKKAAKPARPVAPSPEVVAGLKKLHAAYGFSPEVYAFVGLGTPILAKAGVSARSRKAGPSIARRSGGGLVERAA